MTQWLDKSRWNGSASSRACVDATHKQDWNACQSAPHMLVPGRVAGTLLASTSTQGLADASDLRRLLRGRLVAGRSPHRGRAELSRAVLARSVHEAGDGVGLCVGARTLRQCKRTAQFKPRALRAHLRVGCYGVAHVVDGPLALVRVPQKAKHSLGTQTHRGRTQSVSGPAPEHAASWLIRAKPNMSHMQQQP